MTTLKLIVAVLGLLRALATLLERRQVQDAERIRVALELAEATSMAVLRADHARSDANSRNADPERLRDDDGHKRD